MPISNSVARGRKCKPLIDEMADLQEASSAWSSAWWKHGAGVVSTRENEQTFLSRQDVLFISPSTICK